MPKLLVQLLCATLVCPFVWSCGIAPAANGAGEPKLDLSSPAHLLQSLQAFSQSNSVLRKPLVEAFIGEKLSKATKTDFGDYEDTVYQPGPTQSHWQKLSVIYETRQGK